MKCILIREYMNKHPPNKRFAVVTPVHVGLYVQYVIEQTSFELSYFSSLC